MYTESFEQWLKANKNFSAPMGELNKAGTDFYRRIAQQNIELLSENYARFADQLQRLSQVKKPEELLHLQKECLNEDMTAGIENMQKLVHLSIENMEELTRLFSTARDTAMKPVEKEREKHSK